MVSVLDSYLSGFINGLEPWPGLWDFVLCSWARHLTLTGIDLSTHVRLPAQPEPMKYVLASQSKNTIG